MKRVRRYYFTIDAAALGKPLPDKKSFVALTDESLNQVRDYVVKEILHQESTINAKDVTKEHAQHRNEFVIETGDQFSISPPLTKYFSD